MNRLRPTLWRTCRVLASETRLDLLQHLFEQGELCVSELAAMTGVSPHNASTQLRALNARGLIARRREKQKVIYRTAGISHENSLALKSEDRPSCFLIVETKPRSPEGVGVG